jgi:hypothetical protein
MTVDEARAIIRDYTEHDFGTVQRAMRVIEQDANEHWGLDAPLEEDELGDTV